MSKPFTPTVIVGEVVAGESTQTRTQLEMLINSVNKSTLDIGELLYKVKAKGFYTGWGFNTFKEYTSTLNLKDRKAQYLTRIVGVMKQVGIKRTQYEPLGIARLREITSLDPNENWTNPESLEITPIAEFIKGFVEKGEEIEMDQLKQHVRTLKGQTGDNDLVWINLYVTRSVADNTIRPALELAKAHIGSVKKDEDGVSQDASDGAAAEVLAISFLNDPTNKVENLNPPVDDEDNGAHELMEGIEDE